MLRAVGTVTVNGFCCAEASAAKMLKAANVAAATLLQTI
jgi:microcompartment protein CcmL/EutN